MPEDSMYWHAAALEDLRQSELSISEIAIKYGRRPKTIEKLLYRSGIVRTIPHNRRGPKRKDNVQPLSKAHHSIGLKLNMARGNEKLTAFASKIGVSAYVLGQMENGHHDFGLLQIMTISELLGLGVEEMMKSYEQNIYKQRGAYGPR